MKQSDNILKYSLNNDENYNETIGCDLTIITGLYVKIINEYLQLIVSKINKIHYNLNDFILIRGIDTITHVFNKLLISTKNLNLTYYHCQKSYFSYIEFVTQITADEKMYLKLTTRDASIYVYKRTITNLNSKYVKSSGDGSYVKNMIPRINVFINIYQIILLKIIKSGDRESLNLNHIENELCELSKYDETNKLLIIVDELYNNVNDVNLFLKAITSLITLINKTPTILNNEVNSAYNYDDFTSEKCNIFVNNIFIDK